MDSNTTAYFFQQGILGVIIVVLGSVIVWQQTRIDKKDTQMDVLQDKRKIDSDTNAGSYTVLLTSVLNTLNILQNSVKDLADVVKQFMNGRTK